MHENLGLQDVKVSDKKDFRKKLIYIGNEAGFISSLQNHEDYKLITFDNAFQAFPWLRYNALTQEVKLDALISDSEFPGGNAFILHDIIKNNHVYKNLPFVVLSKQENNREKLKAKEAGFDDYYSAPFNYEHILTRIDFLRTFKSEKEKLKASSPTHAPAKVKMFFLKRVMDILISGTALLVLSPILLLIAALIRLESKGPIFYISKRAGSGYKIINFYKFRSMRQGADKELKNLIHMNQYGNGSFVKINNDPRVTKIGAFLRNTSLDEIPQLINVLLGDMSIVGNRPLPLYEAEKLTKDKLAKRFLAPAGITGLWQVTKRGKKEMSDAERMNLDIEYAEKASVLFDMQIMMKTIPALLQKEAV